MDKRYIGVVVKTRNETKRAISQVVATKFFKNYHEALKWLREYGDYDLRQGKQKDFARYIKPVNPASQYYIQP